jgi:hypothetical protein
MTNNRKSKYSQAPSEENLRWEYFCAGDAWPDLKSGQRVLVCVWGRRRVAVCQGPIAGRLRWAQLCAPVNNMSRVIVSANSLLAVEKDEK